MSSLDILPRTAYFLFILVGPEVSKHVRHGIVNFTRSWCLKMHVVPSVDLQSGAGESVLHTSVNSRLWTGEFHVSGMLWLNLPNVSSRLHS